MANMYLDRLLQQREDLRADAKNILDNAAGEDRDVSDAEREAVESSYRSVSELDKQIEPLHQAELRQVAHDQQIAELQRASRARREKDKDSVAGGGGLAVYRGKPGDWLSDWGAKVNDPAAAQRIHRALAEYRVVADQKLADNAGIVPVPIIGPLVDTLVAARPFINSVQNRPLPAGGSTFNRPRITQHALVGVQATEKTQLSSQKLTIDALTVTKKTYGGTLDISFQDRDWTDPAILAIAVSDLASLFANTTDDAAADAFVTAATQTFVVADAATAAVLTAGILNASAAIYASIKRMPDTIWMSPDEWSYAAGLNTAQGTPAFPGLANATSMGGGSMLGLTVVVDGNFAAKTTVVGVSSYAEHYEQAGSLLAVTEPTILGYTIAYYGYVADVTLNAAAYRKRSAT